MESRRFSSVMWASKEDGIMKGSVIYQADSDDAACEATKRNDRRRVMHGDGAEAGTLVLSI